MNLQLTGLYSASRFSLPALYQPSRPLDLPDTYGALTTSAESQTDGPWRTRRADSQTQALSVRFCRAACMLDPPSSNALACSKLENSSADRLAEVDASRHGQFQAFIALIDPERRTAEDTVATAGEQKCDTGSSSCWWRSAASSPGSQKLGVSDACMQSLAHQRNHAPPREVPPRPRRHL